MEPRTPFSGQMMIELGFLQWCHDVVCSARLSRLMFSSGEKSGVDIDHLTLSKWTTVVDVVGWSRQASWQTDVPNFMCSIDVL
ncbi:hypothetical protein TNCV_4246931 [Trichonephila clavipes]|nr:hypothetical protein TNCV_4246931 [Trichonephila clavipes]